MKVSVVCHGQVKPLANPYHSSTPMDHTCSRAATLYGPQSFNSSFQNWQHGEPSLDSYQLNQNGISYHGNERHGADSSIEGLSSSTQLSEEELHMADMAEVNPISFDVLPATIRVKPDIHEKQCMDQSGTSTGPFDSYSYSRSHSRSPPRSCRDINILFEAEPAYPAVCISECHCTEATWSGKNSPTMRHVLHPSDGSSCSRIRLMCSFGGKIMPRPADGKLRYGGGETRIISVNRDMNYQEFMWKMSRFYGTPVVLKYQLPGEDLDALVSVSSDEDLQNMIDEYDRLELSGGLSRLRLFFFTSPSEYDVRMSDVEDGHTNLNQQYVNALNGIRDKLSGFHLEDGPANTLLSPFTESGSRIGHEVPNIRVGFPGTKHFSRTPSAPSSSPSSPSLASALWLSGMGEASKEPVTAGYSHAVENKSQVVNQDGCTEVTSPFYCDHQHPLSAESLRMPSENLFSRGKSYQIPKTGGIHGLDTQANLIHPSDRLGDYVTDAGLFNSWHDGKPSPDTAFSQTGFQCNLHHPKKVSLHTSPPAGHLQVGCCTGKNETIQHFPLDMHTLQHSPSLYYQHPHRALSQLHHPNHCCVHQQPMSSHHENSSYVQPHLQAHPQVPLASSATTSYKMGSAPSSPRVAISEHRGKCSCQQQYSQVHRGINVSLGEPPHSNRTWNFVEQYPRKHAPICSSRFCDNLSHCWENVGWQPQPNHFAGIEGDNQQMHLDSSWQQHDASSPCCQLGDYHPTGHPFHYCDPPAFTETLHASHDLHEKYANRCCCLNCSEQRKHYIEKSGHSVYMEQQDQIGDHGVHQLISVPLDEFRLFGSGRSPFSKDEVYRGEPGAENYPEGGVEGELEVSSPVAMPVLHHVQSHLAGENDSGCLSKSASFSSTIALAGSWSMPPIDHEGWLDHRRNAMPGNVSESPLSTDTSVEAGGINVHMAAPMVAKIGEDDAYSCTSTTADRNGGKSTTKLLSLSPSPTSLEASYHKAHSSGQDAHVSGHDAHVSSHDVVQVGSSASIQVASTASNSWEHYPHNSLSMTTLENTCSTLAFPLYDQSPSSSSNTLNFCFEPRDGMGVSAGSDVNKQALVPTASLSMLSIARGSSKERESGNTGTDCDMAKVKHKTLKEIKVEEDRSRATVVMHSLTGQGRGVISTDADLDSGRMSEECSVGSRVANEVIHEDTIADLGDECLEEPEEFPVSQAEAEAIARGLQIIKNDDLEDLRELGSGTYGTVFHGKWRGSDVAIKRIKASCFDGPPSMQERLISDFWREAGTLSQLHHPNIVAFYGVVPDGPGGTLATVTEYMVNGSLRQVLQKKDRTIDRKKRFLIAMDAAFGMEYLHSKNIVHFDLKSENLLVNMRDAHRPICKVGDFGLSKVKHHTLVSGGVRGTLPWMAPELLNGKNNRVTEKIDVYSFGIVMWELLTGDEPYANMHCGAIIGGIVNNTLRPPIPNWCDPGWKTLMERCWSADPADRPLFSEVARDLRGMAVTMNVK